MRPFLSAAAFLSSMAVAFAWLGIDGLAGFAVGLWGTWLLIGIGYGWWIGWDQRVDLMIADLIVWLKDQRRNQS